MTVSFTRRAVLRAAIKGHVVKTLELKASKATLKSLVHFEHKRAALDVIQEHRQDFRREGRALHLAYNFAKGTPYKKVEANPGHVDLPAMAKKISDLVRCTENPVREWLGLEVLKPRSAREIMQSMGRAS